jgi:hypothetical protein
MVVCDGVLRGTTSSEEDSSLSFRRFFRFLLPIAVGSPTIFDDEDVVTVIADDGIPIASVCCCGTSGSVDDDVFMDADRNDRFEMELIGVRSGETGGWSDNNLVVVGKMFERNVSVCWEESVVVTATAVSGCDGAMSRKIPVRTAPRSKIANRIFLATEDDLTAPMAAIECSPDMVQSHDKKQKIQANTSFKSGLNALPPFDAAEG